MDKKYGGNFKKPRSLLGRRSQRFSLSGNNDSRLEPISESAPPTPSTSRQDTTLTADESLPLGYDSLCDETLRTPLSHKFSSHDYLKTPTYSTNLRMPLGFTDSHKKTSRFARPEHPAQKSVSLQTSRELDIMGTPPHVLRRRLNITSSAFTDLEEEYNHLQKFTTLEKQVLSVEGMAEVQNENTQLKVNAYHLLEEVKTLKEKIAVLENNSSVAELQSEIESLKKQYQIVTDEAASLKEKLQGVSIIEVNMIELQSENESLKNELKTLNDEAASLRDKLQDATPGKNIAELEAEIFLLKDEVQSLTNEATSLKGKLLDITSENEKLSAKFELTNHKLIDLEMVSEAKEIKWCRREEELTKSLQEAWTLLENSGVRKDSINPDKPFTCEIEKYNLQDDFKEKIKILNNLQLEIASTQSLFVSELDNKNLRINSLVEKAKTKFEQINKESEKIKTLEELLHSRESSLEDLKFQLDSIKQNALNHIFQIYECLSDNKFSDLMNFDKDLLVDLKQLHDKISSDEITADNVLEGVNLKLISLAKVLIDMKEQDIEKDKNFNDLLQEKDVKISNLSTELSVTNNTIKNLDLEIKEKDVVLNDLHIQVQEKESIIVNLSDKLTDYSGKLESNTEELNKKKQTLDIVLSVFDKLGVVASLFSPDPILVNESNFEEILNLMNVKYLEFFDLTEHLRNVIDSRDDKISILAQDILSMKLSNEELKSFISKYNQELEDARSNIETYASELQSKDELIIKITNNCNTFEAETKEYESRVKILEQNLSKAAATIETKNKDVKELKEKLDMCNCDEVISQKELHINTMREYLFSLDNEMSSAHHDVIINSYDDIILCLKTKFSCLNNFNEKLKNEIQFKEDQLKEITNHYDELKVQMSKADNKTKELVQKLDMCHCVLIMNQQQSFLSTISNYLSSINSDTPPINNYNDIICCLSNIFSSNNDLIEHLRNKIESKEDQLKEVTKNVDAMKEQIIEADTKIKELQEKIDLCQCNLLINEQRSFFKDVEEYLFCIDSDVCPINNYGDIITCLETKFSFNYDLNEHLRNKIESKEDQLKEVTKNCDVMKEQIIEADTKIKKLQEKVDLCQCSLLINEQQSFFNTVKEYLSCGDSDVSPINNYGDIITCLETKFSSNDLNEHLRNKIESKENKLKEITNSCNIMKKKIAKSDAKTEALKNTIKSKDEQLQVIVHICNSIKNELQNSYKELSVLETSLQTAAEEFCILKQREEQKQTMIESLLKNISELNSELECCSDNFSLYKLSTASQISEIQDLKEHLENKLQSKRDVIMKMSQEYQHLKETSLFNENRFAEELSMKITETETLKASEKHLAEYISNLENQISELEEVLGSKNCELKVVCDTNEYISKINSLELNLTETLTDAENKNQVIKKLQEKLEQCCCDLIINEQQAFFNTVKDFFSSFETDLYPISSYDDIICLLNKRFSLNYDLNELLRDKIESKDDQLKVITNSIDIMKEQLVNAEKKQKELQKKLDLCYCSQLSNEQQLFFSEIKDHLSSIDCCHCPINKYGDIINCLKNKISYINDLNEHLRNKIESKEDQLNEILFSFSVQKNKLEDSHKEVSELESQLHKTEEELFLLRQIQNEEEEVGIKQVQDEIRQLNGDLKLSLDSFSLYKQNMVLKISELEDLKEHLDNKLQSKSDQILKITQELKLLKEKGSSEEEKLMKELSFKDYEIQSLKASEKQLTEYVTNLENKISQLEEDLDLKKNEYKIVDNEYKSQIEVLELNLRETMTTIKGKNEVIQELLEKLGKCRCETVIKEQLSFFNSIRDCLSSIDTDVYSINTHDDIIYVLKNKLSSITDLNEHLRNKIESKDDQLKEISNTCDNMKEQITSSDNNIKELQEKLSLCSCNVMISELHSFIGTLSDYFSSIDSDMSPLSTYSDIVFYIKNRFSANNDLNEHLRNKIKSKEEQLEDILNHFSALKNELDETRKELSELQTKQCYSEKELCLLKQREEEKESHIEQLQEQITQLNCKLELSSDNFSSYEKNIGSKISELEDLKEHLENKLQSKSEQLIKMSQEYHFLKETGLSNEKRSAEELSLKMAEIEVLKASEKHLFECISNLENQIAKLEEEIDLKKNECKEFISKLECSSSIEENNKSSNLNEDISSLEKQLSEAFKELDTYKTNEVNKDNDIIKLELQVSELNSSLASKSKEIHNYNENMDRLSQNIVELIQDKESFFDQLKIHLSFPNFKTFDDVVEIVKSNHSELMALKNYMSNNVHSNDDHKEQLETLRNELNSLKKDYGRAIIEFEEYRTENPCNLVSSIRECDKIVSDMLTTLSSNQPEMDFSSLCIKEKINKISYFINELLIKNQCLEEELEYQKVNNSVNIDFIEQINSDIFNRIESTNQVINNLCVDVSMYKAQFDERIALRDSDIESLQKEVDLSLMDVKELVTVSEKQNNDILCLTNAYLNLQAEYESIIDQCKTSVKCLYESDNNLLNEYESISQDLLTAIYELMNTNYLNTPLFTLNRDVFSYFETLILNFSELFTEVYDKLCLDFINYVESLKGEHENIPDECDWTSSVVCDLKSLKLEPCDFASTVRPYDIGFEELAHCENLFELIDSISVENKMLGLAYSTQKKFLLENIELFTNRVNKQHFKPYTMNIGGNADVSLLMSVVDETVLENVDSSLTSVDKNDTLSESFASPCPEKTQYILPEGHINTSDVQLEKTLYLPNSVENGSSSSDVDPLKAIDKTMASGYTNAWLNFDNKFNRHYLDESGAEFLDAQDSVEEIDPFVASLDPVPNKVEENLFTDLSSDLKKILRIQSDDHTEILAKVKAIIVSIDSIKTCVQENYPDIAGEKVDSIVMVLLEKISLLEKDKLNLYKLYQTLYLSLCSAQKSIEQLKNLKNVISCDLEKTQKHVFNHTSIIFKHLERSQAIILAQDKDTTLDVECFKRDQEKLKNSYDCCLNELQCALKTNKDLEKSLEEYKELFKDSLSKYEELLTEQNCLKMECEKVKKDYNDVKEVAKDLKDNLESKNNEAISLNYEIRNLQSNIASSEKRLNDNDNKLKLIILENTNLLSEVVSLKDQIDSSRDLNVRFEKQSSELSSLKVAYDLLKTNHDDLINKFLDAQKIVESIDKGEHKSLLHNNDVVEGLQKILRVLDFDDDYDLRDNIAHTLSKIQRRISLLLEHHSDAGVVSSSHEINDLNQKIRSLESDLYDASSFKLSFTKELRSLKPELEFNDLLKRPLNELHTLMITEIMSRENSIISNLKSEYENKITSLKDELHQFIEKDKRRAEWVSEVESDNEQLNIMTKKLKEDVHSATERLESKILCENHIVIELKKLEQKMNDTLAEDSQISSQEIDLDILKKSEVTGEILVKLQKIVKNYLPSDESACYNLDKYKESIKALEVKCLDLQNQVIELEQHQLDSSKEIIELKSTLTDKTESHKKEINNLNRSIRTLENTLCAMREKLNFAEERAKQEQEQLQREKAFSVKTLEENIHSKKQLEEHIERLHKMNMELNDAKETIKSTIFKHEEEICSLMKVITDLECELKLSRRTEEEKGSIESELFQANSKLSDLKQEYDSRIIDLENENKTIKNEINLKLKELSILKEEHMHEIKFLKSSLNDNININSSLKNTNEDLISKISVLESELSEKEALYRDSVAKLMRERENNMEKIETLEEFATDSRKEILELENKLTELDKMCNLLTSDFNKKESNYKERIQEMECLVEVLKKKIEVTEDNLVQKEKAHIIEINDLNYKINEYLKRISQLDKCFSDSKESEKGFNADLLKLFPECSECSTELLSLIKSKLAEISALKEELEDKNSECRYLEEDCDEMIKKVEELRKTIGEVYRAQFEDETKYKSLLGEKDAAIEKLESQISNQSDVKLNEIKSKENIITTLEQNINILKNRLKETEVSITNLNEENTALRKQISQKPSGCKECKQIMDQVIHFKAKLSVKEVKIAELTGKMMDMDAQKKEVSKENDAILKMYIDKIEELEKEKVRLTAQVRTEHPSVSPLKDINNQQPAEVQSSKITKLEARITKLEKDREFLKRLCEKRATVINELKHELDSKKK